MSLDKPNLIDAAGIENETGFAVLTIADSWDWADERNHLLALQTKLNAYFAFIETGQLLEHYPEARGRQVLIDVVVRFPVPAVAREFLKKASATSAELGVLIRCRQFK